jgi:hypothetical protein
MRKGRRKFETRRPEREWARERIMFILTLILVVGTRQNYGQNLTEKYYILVWVG